MSISDLYDTTATVKRKVETDDGQGSVTTALNDLIVDMPCHIWPLTGKEQDAYLKKEVIASYGLITAPQATTIIEKDVVIWNGAEYDVTFVNLPIAKQKYLKLLLELRA